LNILFKDINKTIIDMAQAKADTNTFDKVVTQFGGVVDVSNEKHSVERRVEYMNVVQLLNQILIQNQLIIQTLNNNKKTIAGAKKVNNTISVAEGAVNSTPVDVVGTTPAPDQVVEQQQPEPLKCKNIRVWFIDMYKSDVDFRKRYTHPVIDAEVNLNPLVSKKTTESLKIGARAPLVYAEITKKDTKYPDLRNALNAENEKRKAAFESGQTGTVGIQELEKV
jgi:hypothetical protein